MFSELPERSVTHARLPSVGAAGILLILRLCASVAAVPPRLIMARRKIIIRTRFERSRGLGWFATTSVGCKMNSIATYWRNGLMRPAERWIRFVALSGDDARPSLLTTSTNKNIARK